MTGDDEKSAQLMVMFDQLNQTFGKKTVFFACEGMQQAWAMKQQAVTPAHTTKWSDLPL